MDSDDKTFLIMIGMLLLFIIGAFYLAGSFDKSDKKYRVLQTYGYETMQVEMNQLAEDGWSRDGEISAQAYPDLTSGSGMTIIVTQVMSK